MKKLLILALAAVVLVPAAAQAGPILAVGDVITLDDYYNSNSGGPFEVTNLNPDRLQGWLTFCVEESESLDFQHLFVVTGIGDRAWAGGVDTDEPAVPGDPLNPASAYLYTKYLAMGGSTDLDLNNDYQKAIWYLENEPSGVNNLLVAEAIAQAWNGIDKIRVVNLAWAETVYNRDGSIKHAKGDPAQDILVRVPDGGATLTLLGFALLGVGVLRRKLGA